MPVQFYFLQDEWKAKPNLTLTLGIRYEYQPVPLGYLGAANAEVASGGVPLPVQPDKNNWAPRIGFAYSPTPRDGIAKRIFGSDRTSIRGGFGMAYNPLFIHLSDVRNNYPRAQFIRSFAPATTNIYPQLPPVNQTSFPFDPRADFTNLPTYAEQPTTNFYSFSIQRGIGASHLLELGYSGSRNYHQSVRTQTNPAILTSAQASQVIATGNVNAIPAVPLRRIHPEWGSRVLIEPAGISSYNAAFVRFDRSFSNGLLGSVAYTYSSNLSDNDGADLQNYFDRRNDYARSIYDRPHRLVVNLLYQTPRLSGHSRFVREALANWQITGLQEWQSGEPFTITTGVDSPGNGLAGVAFVARPDYNPAGVITLDPVTNDWRTFRTPANSTSIFVTPRRADGLPLANAMPSGGTLGRNTFRAPSFVNTNLSIGKIFTLTERWRLELRGEATNALNHRNFGPPVAVMSSPLFGTNATDPGGRTVQLLAKIRF